MTTQQQRTLTIGVLTAVLAALVLAIGNAAWDAKVDRAEYDLHVAQKQADIVAVERQVDDVRAIVLDLLCAQQPTHRRCR